jgi:hypothetical protein
LLIEGFLLYFIRQTAYLLDYKVDSRIFLSSFANISVNPNLVRLVNRDNVTLISEGDLLVQLERGKE